MQEDDIGESEAKKKNKHPKLNLLLFIIGVVAFLDIISPMTMIKLFDLDNSFLNSGFEAIGLTATRDRRARSPEAFDVVAGLKTASMMAENRPLLGFSISNLRSDGTVDLNATESRQILYRFGRPSKAKKIEGIAVIVLQPGTEDTSAYPYKEYIGFHSYNSEFRRAPFVDNPKCTLKELWNIAAKIGADESRVANVTYNAAGYRFKIPEDNIDLHFWIDCSPK